MGVHESGQNDVKSVQKKYSYMLSLIQKLEDETNKAVSKNDNTE